jgi:ABC-type anion transport system duplicated permease subunit
MKRKTLKEKIIRAYRLTIRTALMIGIMWAGIAIYNHENKPVENVQNVQNTELEQVMSREDLRKQYELMAREVLLKEKKAKIEAEYQTSINAINAELEEVRSQKVGF